MSLETMPEDTVSMQVYVDGWNAALSEIIDLAEEIHGDATSDKQRKQMEEIIGTAKLLEDFYGMIKDGIRTNRTSPRAKPRFLGRTE